MRNKLSAITTFSTVMPPVLLKPKSVHEVKLVSGAARITTQ